MTAESNNPENPDFLVDRSYRDKSGHFRFALLAESMLCVVRFRGKGSKEGARAFVDMLEQSKQALPEGQKVLSMNDCSELHSTPIRAQFIIGKWLFKNKKRVEKVAVYGAKPWETKLAKAIFKIAGMKAVSFHKDEDAALTYLGLEPGTAPPLPSDSE